MSVQMPAWATQREDSDQGTPDAWTEFAANMGSLTVLSEDQYAHEDTVTLVARATTEAWDNGQIAPFEPVIEIHDAHYGNVVFALSLADARTLAELLIAAVERIEATR